MASRIDILARSLGGDLAMPTADEVRRLFALLFTLTQDELVDVMNRDDVPVFVKVMCKDMLRGGRNSAEIMRDIRNWLWGEAKKDVDVSFKNLPEWMR